VTTATAVTQIPGAEGEQVDLTCSASSKPAPYLSWKRKLNGTDLTLSHDGQVESITVKNNTSVMKVIVSTVGETFFCVAVNLVGRNSQKYTIRERGKHYFHFISVLTTAIMFTIPAKILAPSLANSHCQFSNRHLDL